MDTETPEVCLGPVAESYPPQCNGPELVGWEWGDHDGMFERQGESAGDSSPSPGPGTASASP
jgi:hypothetical protein